MSTGTVTLGALLQRGTLTMTHGGRRYVDKVEARDGWEHYATRCKLTYQGRSMVLTYKQGVGHVDPPTRRDVMESVLMDSASLADYDTFEEWARQYGEDDDSRAAKRLWHSVRKQDSNLRRLLGDDYAEWTSVEVDW